MDVRQFKYFVEICKYGSFAQAAATCNISPQGISMAIQRLEDELSCKLFRRTYRGIALTEDAEFMLPLAEEIVQRTEKLESYFSSDEEGRRKLPLLFAPGTIQEFAGQVISNFEEQHPDIHIIINEAFPRICDSAVENQKVELAFTILPVDESKFENRILFKTPYALIVHDSHPISRRKSITVKDLRDVPVVVTNKDLKAYSSYVSICCEAGFEPKIAAIVDDVLAVFHFAEDNKGLRISTVPCPTVWRARMFAPFRLKSRKCCGPFA
jgi:DNA-binding transcriptional LysR family regulator